MLRAENYFTATAGEANVAGPFFPV